MAKAYIGMGSNLGDRQSHIEAARVGLSHLPLTQVVAMSKLYETSPVGPVDQGMFLNAAACIETALSPMDLLKGLQAIEQDQGRAARSDRTRWGPREVDLDILFYDQKIMTDGELVLPHPQLHLRWFVLKPLADLAPELVHPVSGKSIATLLEQVKHRCG